MVNLLVVDDQARIRDSFLHHFRSIGWNTHVAKDGVEAVEIISEQPLFDGIVLDKNMPKSSGDQVVDWLYERGLMSDICVVLLTGVPEMQSAIESLRKGVWQYLLKDLTPSAVQSFIAPGIAQRKMHRIRRNLWRSDDLFTVLETIERIVQETLAADGVHVIFLSSFLSKDLSDGTRPDPNRAFVRQIAEGLPFVVGHDRSTVAALQPVLSDACTLMAVPVHDDRGVLGVLEIESLKANAFDARLRDVLFYFAETLSLTQTIYTVRQAEHERSRHAELARTTGELRHRMVNSLSVIKQSGAELLRDALTEHGRKRAQYIAAHSERIENVLRELKDIATAQSVSCESVDVIRIIRDTAGEVFASDSDVVLSLPQQGAVFARADEEHLRYALGCVIRNALEAIEERRERGNRASIHHVTVSVQVDERDVTIEIGDDGIGFDRDLQERLFNPLFSTKVRSDSMNSGYGLYTSERVVKAMKGSMSGSSQGPYQGATFTIRLPRR